MTAARRDKTGARRALAGCALLIGTACAGGNAAAPPALASAPPVGAGVETSPGPPQAPAPAPAGGRPLLEFFGLGRGDRMADLGAGAGYSSADFAHAVGPFGTVYVRHAPRVLSALPGEAAPPPQDTPSNVIRMVTPIDAPFLPEARDLSCVTFLFGYQELVAENRDRSTFNLAVFRALQPGGLYIIADHAPAPGPGLSSPPNANRIEARLVQAEVEAAGFQFVEAADFLSSALQTRSAQAGRTAQTSQYILKFRKPVAR